MGRNSNLVLLVVVVVVMFGNVCKAQQGNNLLTNPGFEASFNDVPSGWNKSSSGSNVMATYSRSSSQVHSGSGAQQLAVTSLGFGANAQLWQIVPSCSGGRKHEFRVWLRSSQSCFVTVQVRSTSDTATQWATGGVQVIEVLGGSAWTEVVVQARYSATSSVSVGVLVQGVCTLWVDDASFKDIETDLPYVNANNIPARALGFPEERVSNTNDIPVPSDIGAFRTVCSFSHFAFDDPIVFPNQPGRSHLHLFFGNTLVNAHTTTTSLTTTGNSTCRGGIVNRSGYWVPAMIDTRTGTPIVPRDSHFYYKTGYNGIAPSAVQAVPQGLRMVTGDAAASTPSWSYRFACIGDNVPYTYAQWILDCPVGSEMWFSIGFPQCWDGVNLDSPNHKSHVADPVNGACPSTHPVPFPGISFNVVYPVTEANVTSFWRLASDNYDPSLPGGYSAHADWYNGWKTDIMATWIQYCSNLSKDCHSHLLGDGRQIY